MKRGYKKLLIFELIIFIILFLNSFVWNILSSYKISIFLLVVLLIFKGVFGFEKDKHRYTKDLIMEVIIYLIAFFILYYLFGIVITFYKTGNYYTLTGLKDFIIPTIIYIILKEYLRYMIMCKSEGNRLLFVTTVVVFILMDITTAIYFRDFKSNYSTFLFVALTFLPALSSNVVLCYFTNKTGYKPLILYLLVIGLYKYILPIVPNPDEYISSIINFILPIGLAYRLYLFLRRDHQREIDRDYRKKHVMPLAISSLIVIILVYFTSGYFHYWGVAVASGSMNPKIKKGDVAIIEKIDGKYDTLKKGQVIAFKYEGVIVVHRLIDVIKDQGKYYFYTKGDANANPDNFVIEEQNVIGTVDHKISYLGIPTVWINELWP